MDRIWSSIYIASSLKIDTAFQVEVATLIMRLCNVPGERWGEVGQGGITRGGELWLESDPR